MNNLRAEMARRNITIETIANLLDIHRNSAARKVNGLGEFTISEAIAIKEKYFHELEYAYLFERNIEK